MDHETNAKNDKISLRRLISNVAYIMKFAVEIDRRAVITVFIAFFVCSVTYAVYSTLFLKYFIQIMQRQDVDLVCSILFVLCGVAILFISAAVEIGVQNWTDVRFLRVSGDVQRKFIRKAADIDLICYDNKKYFDDFVIAASQSEEMLTLGVISTGYIIGNAAGILTLGALVLSVNPVIAVFPLVGFVVNIITRFKITEYEYNYEMEYKRIMRKADYSKRVFYQPEYAKEIKLSDIRIPLKLQFNEAVEEVTGKAHEIGVKIALLSLVNWIATFTVMSDFAIPVYLGYLALVRKSIALGDVAAMNNAEEGIRNNLDGMNYALVRFQKVGQFAERFRRFVDYEIQIENKQGIFPMPQEHQTLEVKHMSFRYDGADRDTLHDISLTIKPGEKVAFVGENGAGKTTLVKLLMHLYDVTDGSICYGGHDIREYGTGEYRERIGAVFQDYQIYGATLAENVLMDEVEVGDRERILEALKQADFEKRLLRLPDGLDTNMTREFREDGTMLSGGEAQRIRLATQIGSGLVGVAYILDEPSIGLHQRDNDKLLGALMKLKDLGNTLIVVEHDEDTMLAADYIVDIGPGAGSHGGKVIATGTAKDIMACKESITGDYLSGRKKIPVPEVRKEPTGWIKVKGAKENNLKNINVEFPTGVMTCVTGVSGSGKSSLVNEILYKYMAKQLNRARTIPGLCNSVEGLEQLDKVINIDQSPIGRTPRSNPATYTGVFDMIRDLFAATPDAKAKGYKKGRFSFNVKGGRCENCHGDGIIKIEMNFLPDVYVPCEVCGGKRYNRETLDVKYKGKSIYDVLDMTVEEALTFFEAVPTIRRKIETLYEVGLSYIKLGQPSTTLSGGEAQRIKLATELSRRSTGKTVYVLDEPTTGLHFADVHKLVDILRRLTENGNTVIVIEHNLDVIKTADYIIDLGPEGGAKGGTVIAKGTPEKVAKSKKSYTGAFIKKMLER